MRRLVAAAEINASDCVLEVGGGTGGLTDLLVDCAGHTICVELDRDLLGVLQDRFRERCGLTLIQGDVLQNKNRISDQVVDALSLHDGGEGGCVKLVANLPYQVATPLVMNLLVDVPSVRRLVFTVQAEVADRFVATPNTKAYGPISIVVQALCGVETVARLGSDAFWPRPTVDSVMLRLDVVSPPAVDPAELRGFAKLVRGTFDHRRKTLRSALGYILDKDARDAVCGTVDGTRRPESFSVEEWLAIYRATPGGV